MYYLLMIGVFLTFFINVISGTEYNSSYSKLSEINTFPNKSILLLNADNIAAEKQVKEKSLGDDCNVDEDCNRHINNSECRQLRCECKTEFTRSENSDLFLVCNKINNTAVNDLQHVSTTPAPSTPENGLSTHMLVIMIVLGLMFVGMCGALNLFSRARFRNHRSIFTNPRLLEVAKAQERRASQLSQLSGHPNIKSPTLSLRSPTQSLRHSIRSPRNSFSRSPTHHSLRSPRNSLSVHSPSHSYHEKLSFLASNELDGKRSQANSNSSLQMQMKV